MTKQKKNAMTIHYHTPQQKIICKVKCNITKPRVTPKPKSTYPGRRPTLFKKVFFIYFSK